ncbi:MAG TPA: type II toxin-antitoxin system VapC family toxin [Blastocatellia bacterium]|nr:type II toxin-antitoxin system VapC family toxin [Blastocatellia bacterium]
MPARPLSLIPDGSNIFIDANIFVYGLSGQSAQCRYLLERCSREELTGVTLFETVNEATHRFMLAEAAAKGIIPQISAGHLRKRFKAIATLNDYWQETERILNLNLLFIATDESIIRSAQSERQRGLLLTNDSMIVACMRNYGISLLATKDSDFERISGITVFAPDDVP